MIQPFARISRATALSLRLVMTDVDGTLNRGGETLEPSVVAAIRSLEQSGLLVGLVSGRTDPMLVSMASRLGINGPLIAENGAVARMSCARGLVDLGYSRQPALDALAKLKACYPGCIREREDNAERLVDMVFWADGHTVEDLRQKIKTVQFLDSTYILHVMQKGVDKGSTLRRLLRDMDCGISREEVLVVGDSMTDLPLFKAFKHCVLIPNPDLPTGDQKALRKAALYSSTHGAGGGFAEVAAHLVDLRKGSATR